MQLNTWYPDDDTHQRESTPFYQPSWVMSLGELSYSVQLAPGPCGKILYDHVIAFQTTSRRYPRRNKARFMLVDFCWHKDVHADVVTL